MPVARHLPSIGSKFELFCQRLQAGWLVQHDGAIIIELAQQKLAEFTQDRANFITIATLDPIEFIATLMAGIQLRLPIFCCNPHWGAIEWEQVRVLTAKVDPQRDRDRLMIPTSGATGGIKFAMHTWETLSASVGGFQEFYALADINSVCVLPLYHVSGLMQLWRSLLTDGQLFIGDDRRLCAADFQLSALALDRYFISLVPTQLTRLIDSQPHLLAQFHTILLGGAPPDVELLARARLLRLPVALTYGMTETASQVTSLKPVDFLAGDRSCGTVLPHAEIQLLLATTQASAGIIQIRAKSLMLGYFPDLNSAEYFETDDIGAIDERGYLSILGRNSSKIITGGENIFPGEVANAIVATGLVADVCVVGLPDPDWGQIVTAVYVEGNLPLEPAAMTAALSSQLSRFKIPKCWLKVTQIPRNSLGKIAIDAVTKLAHQLYFDSGSPQSSSHLTSNNGNSRRFLS